MSNKKYTFMLILAVVLGSILVAGGTYAFLVASTSAKETAANSGKLDVDYTITDNITGSLLPSTVRDKGLKTIATAKLGEGSVPASFNIYVTPTVIDGLDVAALKWEVEGTSGGKKVYTNNGTFEGATKGEKIKIVNSYVLTSTDTTFDIYIWLDGSLVTDELLGLRFAASFSADSVPITGAF